MKIKPLHPNFTMPVRGTEHAAGYDIFMPEDGYASEGQAVKVPLGFAAAIPEGYAALLMPRSGVGFKHGVELNNTVGLIDADYRGEWFAAIRTKGGEYRWKAGDRVLQFILVPVFTPELQTVESIDDTDRGEGGMGSTGQ